MAQQDLTLQGVSDATGVDSRTLRTLLLGATRPHAHTLRKLADGLGVSTDEFFRIPSSIGTEGFDRDTNPAVADAMASAPDLFSDWSAAEFEELFSRVGVGGELTTEGAIAFAESINQRRELLRKAAVVFESREADVLWEVVRVLYKRATSVGNGD